LGGVDLTAVAWISPERLEAVLPWGLDPGVYSLTVTNPGGAFASLPDAVVIQQGFGAWTHAAGPEGGSVRITAVHPLTPTIVFAAPEDGGLFRSADGGQSWSLVNDRSAWDPMLAFGADGHTVYVSTGWMDVGVWRSDDNGLTWQPAPIPWMDRGHYVFAHPAQADTVFAILVEQDPQSDGLYRSDDRGAHWQKVAVQAPGAMFTAFAIDPVQPQRMALGASNGAVYASADGGTSWNYAAQALPGRIGFMSFHPSGSGELWVNGYHSECGAAHSNGPDLSAWTPILDGGTICTNYLHLAPLAWGSAYSQTLFYASWTIRASSDGGLTWNDYGGWPGDTVRGLALHPSDPHTVYAGSRLGMHVTADDGASWQLLNHGLTGVAPETMEIRGPSLTVYAQDDSSLGLYLLEQGGTSWRFQPVTPSVPALWNVATGFTIDPQDAQDQYLAAYELILRSQDGGQTWPYTATLPIPPGFETCHHRTIALAADPFAPGVLLAGVQEACGNWGHDPGGLYLSTDYGANWQQRMLGVPISQVNDFAYDWITPGTVYAAASGSGVLRSLNSGITWTPVNNGLNPEHGGLIETAPPDRIYYVDGGALYLSRDQGAAWTLLRHPSGGGAGISALHFTPGDPGVLYMGNPGGLFASLDYGQTWKRAPAPVGGRVVWAIGSTAPDERTVVFAAGVGGVYRLTTVPVLLHGRVTDLETGLPLAGARVAADAGLSALTNPQGYYSLSLPSGVYTLAIGMQDYHTQTLNSLALTLHPRTQDFALQPQRVELSGLVLDGFTGLAIPGAQVQLHTGAATLSGLDGAYSFSLPPGVYTLTAQADGYPPRTLGGLELVMDPWWQNVLLLDPAAMPPWAQVNPDGFGSPANQLSVLEVYQPAGARPYLYAGVFTGGSEARMWRTADGLRWEIAGAGWLTPTTLMQDAQVFNGRLYLGLGGAAAQLWRTDGTTWQAVDTVGFGDANNWMLSTLTVFSGKLYAAVLNQVTGIELWRSSSGDPGTWQQVNQDGFGSPGSGRVSFQVFGGYLYAGFDRVGPAELWRSSNGTSWEPVFTDGLGSEMNRRPALAEFQGQLYLAFRNPRDGGQIWRSANGLDWAPVIQAGFGEPANNGMAGMVAADGALYVMYGNFATGAQVWRTFDGQFWQRANLDGWGDLDNYAANFNSNAAAVFNFDLYVGTLNDLTGGQVWRLKLAEALFLPLLRR
jgi:photosystem II stability/assembly factor-like uncharacterized protein